MKPAKAENPFVPSNLKDAKNEILRKWEDAEKVLAVAKEAEMNLRLQVIDAFYPAHKDEGTENVPLENGYKLKAVFKVNRTLADAEAVNAVLDKIENIDAEGKFISERIIKWKPSLDKKEYDNCPEKYKKFINEVLTTKPATPSLEIIEPKSKK